MSNQENVFETILAPMTGTAGAITEVPDPIFIEKILGDGIAIVPTEGKVVSPVDGTVSKVAETDLEFIKETGRNSITPIVIGSSLEGKELVCEEGEVQAGKTVIMEIKQK